jgi:hypothetical protein
VDTPIARARLLRGAAVGVSSAAMTTAAHAAAGGGVPHGPALVAAVLVCVLAGALVSHVPGRSSRGRFAAIVAALAAGQVCGHLALVVAGHHSGGGWAMAAAHLGAALILGAGIAAAEHLYAVCVSVLCWLRLFAMRSLRMPSPVIRPTIEVVLRQPVSVTGWGMRAPPVRAATA